MYSFSIFSLEEGYAFSKQKSLVTVATKAVYTVEKPRSLCDPPGRY